MNGSDSSPNVRTSHGLAALVILALGLVVLFHFIGLRVVFAAGSPV